MSPELGTDIIGTLRVIFKRRDVCVRLDASWVHGFAGSVRLASLDEASIGESNTRLHDN